MLTMSAESVKRICEVLERGVRAHRSRRSRSRPSKDGSVDFDDVSFKYSAGGGEVRRCRDIDLHIASGQTVGILGGTGSSKSTLVQLIPRLYDVTEGSVKVGGVDVREYDLEALRSAVSVVLQKNVLFSGTIKENLRWGNENATDEELERGLPASRRRTTLSAPSPTGTTPISSRAARTSPADRSSACASPARCSKSRRF